MKKYVYRNREFNGYQITATGSVYKRVNGGLRRITGEEARTQVRLFISHKKRQEVAQRAVRNER